MSDQERRWRGNVAPIRPMIVGKDPTDARRLRSVPVADRYFDEAWVQNLLFRYPDLLAAGEIDADYAELIPLAREFPVRSGSIDLLCVTSEGLPCLVETKLWRNAEAHRTVLAQILDYAKDLTSLSFSEVESVVERLAPRHGYSGGLLDIVGRACGARFDSVAFEATLRRCLGSGNFLLLIVGDRIRPEVALLSEVLGTAPHLEFSLGLVELAFHRLDEGQEWPLLCVPSVVGRTHEVTRAIIKIRYEEKVPEVTVETMDVLPVQGRTDPQTFLKSLPEELTDVYRPYLDRWTASSLIVYWGKVGFSLRYPRAGKLPLTFFEGYPDYFSVFTEKDLVKWEGADDAYRAYRESLKDIRAVQNLFAQGRRYVYYRDVTFEEVEAVLLAANKLAEDLTGLRLPLSG